MSAAWHSSLCRGRGRSRSSSCGTPRRTRRTVRLCCALALVSAAFVGPSPDWNSGLPNAVGRCSTPSTSRRRRRSCGRGCRTHWLAHFPSRTRNNSLSLCRHIPRPSPCPGHRRCCRRCRLRHCSNRRARSRFISGRKPQVSRPTRFLRPASCPYVILQFFSLTTRFCFFHHQLLSSMLCDTYSIASVSSCLIAAFICPVPAPSSFNLRYYVIASQTMDSHHKCCPCPWNPHIHTPSSNLTANDPVNQCCRSNCCMYVKFVDISKYEISYKTSGTRSVAIQYGDRRACNTRVVHAVLTHLARPCLPMSNTVLYGSVWVYADSYSPFIALFSFSGTKN
jgi:hypothetical protein